MANTAIGQWFEDAGNWIYDNVIDPVNTGLENWWYKNTGQAHLTSEYQYEQKLADSAYQRAAADMMAAGLSKFGGVNPASSPSPKSGNGLLATAIAGAQLKGQLISNSEQSHNLKIAKRWGVPTSAVNDFAKYDAVCKLLFGKSVGELTGEGGLLNRLADYFGFDLGSFFGSGSGSEFLPTSEPDVGAIIDTAQNVATEFAPLQPVYKSIVGKSNVFKPVPLVIDADNEKFFQKWKSAVQSGDELPGTGSPAPTTLSLATSVLSKTLGNDVIKDVGYFMSKMASDHVYDTDTIKRVAHTLSLRYRKSEQDIYDYMMAWINEHESSD